MLAHSKGLVQSLCHQLCLIMVRVEVFPIVYITLIIQMSMTSHPNNNQSWMLIWMNKTDRRQMNKSLVSDDKRFPSSVEALMNVQSG